MPSDLKSICRESIRRSMVTSALDSRFWEGVNVTDDGEPRDGIGCLWGETVAKLLGQQLFSRYRRRYRVEVSASQLADLADLAAAVSRSRAPDRRLPGRDALAIFAEVEAHASAAWTMVLLERDDVEAWLARGGAGYLVERVAHRMEMDLRGARDRSQLYTRYTARERMVNYLANSGRGHAGTWSAPLPPRFRAFMLLIRADAIDRQITIKSEQLRYHVRHRTIPEETRLSVLERLDADVAEIERLVKVDYPAMIKRAEMFEAWYVRERGERPRFGDWSREDEEIRRRALARLGVGRADPRVGIFIPD